MTHWDRIQAMQLELAQKDAQIRRLIDDLEERITELTESRDLARRVAMRLEQENHALGGGVCLICAGQIVPVPLIGEAT